MKAVIAFKNMDALIKLIKAALALSLTELQLLLSPTRGLVLNKMDSSRAALLRIVMPPSDFASFDVKEETTVCLDMGNMENFVKRFEKRKDEDVVIEFNDGEAHIMVYAGKAGKSRLDYTLSLMTPSEPSKETLLEQPTVVEVDASVMYNQIEDIQAIGEHAIFEAKGDFFTLISEGDMGKASVQTQLTDTTLVKSHTGPDAKAMYAFNYVSSALKFLKDFETIKVGFADNKPVVLLTPFGSGEIRMTIAPRVERR